MTAGLIGCDCNDLGYEFFYDGPFTHALKNTLEGYVDEMNIQKAYTNCEQGASTIWCWECMASNVHLTAVLSCQKFGTYFDKAGAKYLQDIKKASKSVIVLGEGIETIAKTEFTDKYIIDKSDIMFFVYNEQKTRMKRAIEYTKKTDKEIILINVNEMHL